MLVVCWIPTAINTHLEYVTSIAFPLQQRLQTRALMLHYTYIACRVYTRVGTLIVATIKVPTDTK